MKKLIAPLVAGFVCAAAVPASAAVVYSENFDSYTPALNFTAFNPPGTVTDGTVDVVASGSFGIDCVGGTGNCLDLDGSTRNSGVFSFTLDLGPGAYTISFMWSGNQRSGTDDLLYNVTGIGPGFTGLVSIGYGSISSDAPFQTSGGDFNLTEMQTLTFNWSTSSNDNVGVILDNILLIGPDAEVPEPAMLGLLGLGLFGIGVARRRR